MEKRVIHGNGYSGVLYGESSLSVYNPEGKEVLHTGTRNVNTEQEVLDLLDAMPTMMEILDGLGLMSELLADKLKPCPFCGGEGCVQEHVFKGLTNTYGVVCLDCGAEIRQFYRTEEEAIKAWNRRADG